MLEGARIIKLIDPVEPGGAVTFEEAFGEQSELRGRGRARRHKRKMERIGNRGEEQEARGENKQRRKNKKKSGKISRRRMKKDSEREDNILDAENEKQVSEINPQEEESTGSDNSSDNSGYEEAPEELDQNSEAEETESEFEAGSTSEYTSSFDAESSDASGLRGNRGISDKIHWHKKSIVFHNNKIAEIKKALSTGKLPSNQVASRAKLIRELEAKVNRSKERLSELTKQMSTGRGFTKVNKGLNAKIEPNRIEVPANSSAEGGEDFLGFDAKETIKKNKNVLIGVGVAAAVIVGLHFAGVFKK